jgi:sodium transport system permease protein
MKLSTVAALLRKELIDLLRDRRTLISLVLVAMLVGPVMMTVMNLFVERNQRQAKVEHHKVGLRENLPIPGLRAALTEPGLKVVNTENPRADVDIKAATFGIEVVGSPGPAKVRFYSDNSEMAANMARSRVSEALDKVWRERVRSELIRRNTPTTVLELFERESVNIEHRRKMTGASVGRLLGFLLLTAKVAMALLTSFGTTVLSLSSYAFAFAQLEHVGNSVIAFPTDPLTVVLLAMLVLPVAVVVASISEAAAAPAKSVREAMSYLTPGVFIVMFLRMTTLVTDNWATPVISTVPFANFAQMLRDVVSGEWSWGHYVLTLGANLIYSTIAIAWVVRNFTNEKILFRS